MSALSKEQVGKIGQLARIRLTEEEKEHFSSELSHILDWIEQLNEVDTDQVPPMTSVAAMQLPWRKDEVTDGNCPEKVLANAPENEFNCFVVPKVIE